MHTYDAHSYAVHSPSATFLVAPYYVLHEPENIFTLKVWIKRHTIPQHQPNTHKSPTQQRRRKKNTEIKMENT